MKPITDPAVLARIVTILNAREAAATNGDPSNHEPGTARTLKGSEVSRGSRRAA